MTDRGFLFVNKTSKSTRLAGGNSIEAAAIQHFVQKGRKRARKSKAVPCSHKDSCLQKRESNADPGGTPTDSVGGSTATDGNGTYGTGIAVSEASIQVISPAVHSPNPWIQPAQVLSTYNVTYAIDPFRVTSIEISSEVRSLLHYYTTIFHPSLWPNETQALLRGAYIFEHGVNHVVQYCLQDSLAMYCLLASSSSRLTYLDKLSSSTFPIETSWYMTQALNLMQKRINQRAMQREGSLLYLLQYIIFLSAAEAYRDNPIASRIHLEAAVKLLAFEDISIRDVEPENLQGMMLMSDLFLACVNLEPCLFDSEVYDPGSVSELSLRLVEMSALPSEFQQMGQGLRVCDRLLPSTKVLVNMIREVYETKLCLNTSGMSAQRALETTHWITKRSMAIRNELLSTFNSHASEKHGNRIMMLSGDEYFEESLDSAVRIALIQFTLLSMNITGRIKTVKIMAPYLKTHLAPLLQEGLSGVGVPDSLILWLLIIGYSCSEDGSKTGQWFNESCRVLMKKMFDLGPKPDQTFLAALEQSQTDYFYHAAVQRPKLKCLLSSL